MFHRLYSFVRRYHYVLPLLGLVTLATQIGCPASYPVFVPQKVIKLDEPVTVQPGYVVTKVNGEGKDDVSPPLYYAFQADGNRELQIYPGKHPFVAMIDKTSGKAERVGKVGEPVLAPPLLPGDGLVFDERSLVLAPDFHGEWMVLEHDTPSGLVRRFDKVRGWSRAVPESQADELRWQRVYPFTQEDGHEIR